MFLPLADLYDTHEGHIRRAFQDLQPQGSEDAHCVLNCRAFLCPDDEPRRPNVYRNWHLPTHCQRDACPEGIIRLERDCLLDLAHASDVQLHLHLPGCSWGNRVEGGNCCQAAAALGRDRHLQGLTADIDEAEDALHLLVGALDGELVVWLVEANAGGALFRVRQHERRPGEPVEHVLPRQDEHLAAVHQADIGPGRVQQECQVRGIIQMHQGRAVEFKQLLKRSRHALQLDPVRGRCLRHRLKRDDGLGVLLGQLQLVRIGKRPTHHTAQIEEARDAATEL